MTAMQACIAFHLYFDDATQVDDSVVYTEEELGAIDEYVRRYKGDDTFLLDIQQRVLFMSVRQRKVVVRKMLHNFREYLETSGRAIILDDAGNLVLEPETTVAKPNVAQAREPSHTAPSSVNATPHTREIRPTDTPYETQIQSGIYTVDWGTKHTTLKILPVKDKPDITHVVSVLTGPDNWTEYVGFAWVKTGNVMHVWQRMSHMTDAAKALQQMLDGGAALEAAHCNRCGKLLTVPTSLYAGYGPECARKVGLGL